MKWFQVNKFEAFKVLSLEWYIPRGGYLYWTWTNFTISHRFYVSGNPALGKEKHFLGRFQVALEKQPRFSFFTLELINPFEARWFYIVFKLWKDWNLRIVFNFGLSLSLNSKRMIERNVMQQQMLLRQKVNHERRKIDNGAIKR